MARPDCSVALRGRQGTPVIRTVAGGLLGDGGERSLRPGASLLVYVLLDRITSGPQRPTLRAWNLATRNGGRYVRAERLHVELDARHSGHSPSSPPALSR